MAEFLLSKLAESVVSQAVQRISELLIREAAFLGSVREDVVLLQDELRSLRGFLKDADKKQQHDQRLRELVLQVKDVASDAEDVVDTFIFKVTFSYIKAFHNKRIRTQISFLRERIQIIFRSLQIYGITSVVADEEGTISRAELLRSVRRASPNDEDDDVIILEDSSRALRAELTKEEDRLCIVSVVGMGGLGKTTLAKKVFNTVKHHFDCSAWVFISQQYVLKDVLVEILTQMKIEREKEQMKIEREKEQMKNEREKKPMNNEREKFNSLKENELIDLLKNEIKEKRYLVVLDDIWKIEAWDSVKRAFPEGKKGSKILFTTRNREVATFADPLSSPIVPPILTLEESWELLQRKAFPRGHMGEGMAEFNELGKQMAEFNELGKQMAKKCGGLPLAVVVLGGLLSTKKSLGEWKKVMSGVNSHLSKQQSRQEYEGVREILALSYYDLPYYLKPCFLYLGNFPEDYEISKSKLVHLWIAEGFIPTPKPTRGETEETLEEVGEGYLEELIDRCMVQVEKRDHTGMGVKTCRMHDLMRDLCTNKAREESFAQIIDDQSNMSIDGSAASRRLVIHPGVHLQYPTFFRKLISKESNWVEQVHPNLLSLLCLGGILSLSALKSSNFRMLRVLELCLHDGSIIRPIGMGNLIHLRYLCLRVEYGLSISLSSSIGNLQNLHTLHIENKFGVIIGSVGMISKLIRLRHLLLPYYWSKKSIHDFRIDKLKDIETLKYIPASVLSRNDALNKLTNLRNISIRFDGNHGQDDVRRVLGSQIVQSGRLRSLKMYAFSIEKAFPSLESLSSCHSLSKLGLYGNFVLQQALIHLPESLTKLKLEQCEMEQDPMPVLENKLPNLRFLVLSWNAYVGSTMVCSAHGFPKLDTLQLIRLPNLREWIVEKGAMPSLKKLAIHEIPNLEMIPQGFEFLTSLKELKISGMKESFRVKLQVKNGIEWEDYYKSKHIPSYLYSMIYKY